MISARGEHEQHYLNFLHATIKDLTEANKKLTEKLKIIENMSENVEKDKINKDLKVTVYINNFNKKYYPFNTLDEITDMAFGKLPSVYIEDPTYRVIYGLTNQDPLPTPLLLEIKCHDFWSILKGHKNDKGIYQNLYLLENDKYYVSGKFVPNEKGVYEYKGDFKEVTKEDAFCIINYINYLNREHKKEKDELLRNKRIENISR